MKITCPKCHSSYKVDLPDPGEAGIDVQCGKCLYIFLFSTDTQKSDPAEKSKNTLEQTQQPSSSEDRSSKTILPPQKDEDQEVSGSEKPSPQDQEQAPSLEEKEQEVPELELEAVADDLEPVEIIVEDEDPEESLEEGALDDIWNQAVQEGARTVARSKEKSPAPPKQPDTETENEETGAEAPLLPEKKAKRLPTLEERQREIDQMIADHQNQKKESAENIPVEEDKAQEDIDLEEQVVVDDEEAMPNWEDAFLHQAKVEEGWKKAQEQDRILEEQQLADALGKNAEHSNEEAPDLQEDQQSLVDEIFSETQSPQEPEQETAQPSQPESSEDEKQEEVDPILTEAKSHEKAHIGEQEDANEYQDMPSWEEAFADQSMVETGWKKAQEEDRLHEEQQLADALGEEYVSPESAGEETPVTADSENKQDLVNQLFEEVRSQKESLEPSEALDESVSSSETQETHVGEHTIPGEIDLMNDLDDLNMKQLVTQAFKEESESQEEDEPPTLETAASEEEEVDPEPELTMESMAETLQGPESPSEDPVPEPEMEPISELALESEEEEPEPVEAVEDPELESIPDLTLESEEEEAQEPVEAIAADSEIESLTLESAEEELDPVEAILQEEDSEVETEAETEPFLETAETLDEEEAVEPSLEIEPEPELTMESEEESEVEQPAVSQRSLLEEEEEQIWNDLLAEHGEEEEPVAAEAVTTSAQEEEEDGDSLEENDFWDQVLEKDSEELPTVEPESEPEPVASGVVPDTSERETLTDEELWKQAFPSDEDLEPAPPKHFDAEEEDLQSEPAPLVVGASITPNEESEDASSFDDAAYADYEDEDDEFEFERRKRKLGPFVIPHGRRGDLVIGGVMVVFLLLAGSVYFTLQTFAPGELTEIQTAENKVPEGLTPREVPLDELAGDLITPKPPKPKTTPPVETPGDKGDAILSDPAAILKESPEEKSILKDLAESQILKDTGKSQTAKIDQSALQALSGHSVTMSTIMPVAYNPTDIRVLSFSVEIQLSDAQSAKRVRESLPVYEELMNQTVENFLRRKFYNDILYVKEKLQKRLQTAMNQSLKNGRVKKAKFTDFAIQ